MEDKQFITMFAKYGDDNDKEQLGKLNMRRKKNRAYHRLRSLLLYWEGNGYQILRIDLTSSTKSNSLKLRYNNKKLKAMVERQFGYRDIETYILETAEGNGVLHMVWAWKQKSGFRDKTFYIPFKWLKAQWSRLHQADQVYVQVYDKSDKSSGDKVAGYLVTQYVAGQNFIRYSYSWGLTLGFSMVKFWKLFKEQYLLYKKLPYLEMLNLWNKFMSSEQPVYYFGQKVYINELRTVFDAKLH